MHPKAYYNETDPYCADWLRNLIRANLIAPGEVDTRDIRDVRPIDLRPFTQCHFFAGLGGWSRALRLASQPDHRPLWTGSCPCQPFSTAGQRRGFADERHLWPSWHWLVEQCRPAVVLGEQVASASDWLRLVRGDLEALGYAVGCMPVEAASAGADHLRDRYWFVAHRDTAGSQGRDLLPERPDQRPLGQGGVADPNFFFQGNGELQRGGQFGRAGGDQEARDGGAVAGAFGERCGDREGLPASGQQDLSLSARSDGSRELSWVLGADGKCRRVEPGVRLLAHGVPARVAKLRAFGNAIDPRPAAAFIEAALGSL